MSFADRCILARDPHDYDDRMRFSVAVEVRLRAGIADPQGATIERSLPTLGFDGVAACGSARASGSTVEAADEATARARGRGHVQPLPHQPGDRGRRGRRCEGGRGRDGPRRGRAVPGSNCEHDVVEAVDRPRGRAELLWHGDRRVGGVDAVVRPRRVRPRRLPAARCHRPLLAGDGRGRADSRPTAARSSASATASRSSPRPGCFPGALQKNRGSEVPLHDGRVRVGVDRLAC